MNLVVACVGTRMPEWVAEGCAEYRRRMPPHLPLELIEVPAAGKTGAGRESAMESARLLERVPGNARRIALAINAPAWSTDKLAGRLDDWQHDGDPVWFFIGGANGLDKTLLEQCSESWSLGPATLPHMLVRVIVTEQLYRAWTILSGHPYHRG